MLEWEASLPISMTPDPAWLEGVCLAEKGVGGFEGCLRYLPAEAMPLEPAERVKRLFEARKRWKVEEMGPYMRCVGAVLCCVVLLWSSMQIRRAGQPSLLTFLSCACTPNRGLFPDDKALGSFLTKHTRAALGPNGERVYSAK